MSITLCAHLVAQAPAHVEFATVQSRNTTRTVSLPAELAPFLQADIEARVAGYVDRVLVDRGSTVHRGQILVELSAPEMKAQTAASEASLREAEANQSQAEAQIAAVESTVARLQEAAKTPGAIAANELIQVQQQRDAARSQVESRRAATRAAQEKLRAAREMESYLHVTAPFDGIITDRFAHPGILVQANASFPLLRLQQTAHLRLIVPVPEGYVGAVRRGTSVTFRVPSQPGKAFAGRIARVSQAMDPQSRTMMIEADAYNKDGSLAPGMYPTVEWPIKVPESLLLVPSSSVVSTTERTFVITIVNGRAHWVDVRKGATFGSQTGITGQLTPGQKVVQRATDELREGTPLN